MFFTLPVPPRDETELVDWAQTLTYRLSQALHEASEGITGIVSFESMPASTTVPAYMNGGGRYKPPQTMVITRFFATTREYNPLGTGAGEQLVFELFRNTTIGTPLFTITLVAQGATGYRGAVVDQPNSGYTTDDQIFIPDDYWVVKVSRSGTNVNFIDTWYGFEYVMKNIER